jgi:hypothetical protein
MEYVCLSETQTCCQELAQQCRLDAWLPLPGAAARCRMLNNSCACKQYLDMNLLKSYDKFTERVMTLTIFSN